MDISIVQFAQIFIGSALLGASMTLFVQGVHQYRSEH